jgi:hypothetical protein
VQCAAQHDVSSITIGTRDETDAWDDRNDNATCIAAGGVI